ncbi:hypothetical protein [Roseivivax sp.]
MPLPRLLTAALTLAALAAPSLASAETSVAMEVVRPVATETGETAFEPVETALPGEPLVYRIALSNTDPVPATSVGLSLPLDGNLAIDPASVSAETPLTVRFSADGGASYAPFSELTIEENGETRQAQPTDLTHLQIEIAEIAPESQVAVTYDAVVR